MRDAPPPKSIEVLAAEVRDQLAVQRGRVESLDTKAGVVLGFAGILVVVASGGRALWLELARFAGVVAAVAALLAFAPRDYPIVDLREVRRRYLARESSLTRLALLDTHLNVLDELLLVSDHKSLWLKASIGALLLAIILVSIGIVV